MSSHMRHTAFVPMGQERVSELPSEWIAIRERLKSNPLQWSSEYPKLMSFELWCAATASVPGKETTGGGVALDAKYYINGEYSEQWDENNLRLYKLQYAGAKPEHKEKFVHSPVSQSLHTQSGGGVGNYSGTSKGFVYPYSQDYGNWQAAVAKA
eukprot:3902253-Pleurochrysis_carterae.AAC.1